MSKSHSLPNREDFAEFISDHASKVTPAVLGDLVSRLPELREKVATLEAPGFPKAAAHLGFLADVVESFAADQLPDLPYAAASEAAFGLLYLDRAVDLIPDSLGPIGFTDDAAVAATVLMRHAADFANAAQKQGTDWSQIAPGD